MTIQIPEQLKYSKKEIEILKELTALNTEHLNGEIDKMMSFDGDKMAWDNDYFHVKNTKRGYLIFSASAVNGVKADGTLDSHNYYVAQAIYGIEQRWHFDYGSKKILKQKQVETREEALSWVLEEVKNYKPRKRKQA